MKKKILVIGDYKAAKWHPLKGVDELLGQILNDYELTFTEEYSNLTSDGLGQYSLLVNYADAWQDNGTRQSAGAILAYVAEGGSLLTIHSGIIMKSTPEMELMQGGRFTGHPDACELPYAPAELDHPILDGICPFTIFEEPYRLSMAEFVSHEVLLTYFHDGQNWPAAWTLPYGMGKVAYLSIGHQAKSFENEMFARLIANSAKWCVT
jgi:type 1 glutamine amidotransferase